MIVFQLSCSIFMSLVSRFRPGLKAEIGVFFPMIVLRVLENVAQPIFQQKMIVLRFLEKLCVDSQILVDIFVNYDCDVHSPNIFERYCIVNPDLMFNTHLSSVFFSARSMQIDYS